MWLCLSHYDLINSVFFALRGFLRIGNDLRSTFDPGETGTHRPCTGCPIMYVPLLITSNYLTSKNTLWTGAWLVKDVKGADPTKEIP